MTGRKGRSVKKAAIQEQSIITDGQEDKIVVKRGRKKMNTIPTTNGDTEIQIDKEKINVNTEIPVVANKNEIKSKTTTITKQSTANKNDKKNLNEKNSSIGGATTADDNNGIKPIAVVQPFVDIKQSKGRKKAANDSIATSTTAKKHKINGTDNQADDEIIPAKKGRAAKTKANNIMKENAAASIADDIKEKEETKKNNIAKKKTSSEELKTTTTTGRRSKRVQTSMEKDDAEEDIVEVVEKTSKNTSENNAKKKTSSEELKTTTGRRGKRAKASMEKDEEEEDVVEVVEKTSKNTSENNAKKKTSSEELKTTTGRRGKRVKASMEKDEEEEDVVEVIQKTPKNITENNITKKKTLSEELKATTGRRGKRVTASIEKIQEEEDIVEGIEKTSTNKAEDNMTKKKSSSEELKPTTGRRGKRITASIEKIEEEEDIVEVVESKNKSDTKKHKINDTTDTTKKTKKQPANKKIKINATTTSYDQLDFNLSKEHNLKISSWNVGGLRAWLTKGGLDYITHEKPDIMCLQELKCSEDQIPDEARIPGYHPYWLCKPGGFNGVAIYSKIMPINVEYGLGDSELDNDSRIMCAEYEKFYVICVYVPNSGRKLVTLPKRLRWNEIFHKYLIKLNEKKPVIICGDMNVAHNEIDLTNPKTNKRNAGFTQEERDGMTTLLSYGFIDTYRYFYPNDKDMYTFWTYMANARAKNVGWRLDYFLVSEKFMPKIVDNIIRSKVLGSDHCPLTLFLNI